MQGLAGDIGRLVRSQIQGAGGDIVDHDAEGAVEAFLTDFNIEVVAIQAEARREAIRAHVRYGKGRHPAALNFGDCFAYACARHARSPLLYKGDDFSRTDIEAA